MREHEQGEFKKYKDFASLILRCFAFLEHDILLEVLN